MPRPLALLLAALCSCHAKKGGGRGGGVSSGGFDAHHKVMQLLTPQARGCEASNGTLVGETTASHTAPAYCSTKLPKRRQCIVLSFAQSLDFGIALSAAGCRVLSFDPLGGFARTIAPNHIFVPAGLSTYDGLVKEGNNTFAALTLKAIMDSQELDRVDVLRMTVNSARQWKVLKYLVNAGGLDNVLQLSLNMTFSDVTMWSDYQSILTMVSNHGFKPFYIVKQPAAEYLQVQEGSFSLYSKYEVTLGNVKRKTPP